MTGVMHQYPPHAWTFLSNHSHVLYCISACPDIRIRDITARVQITERAVQRIVVNLERGGYLKRQRVGRQNHYRLEPGLHLRHPLEDHVEVSRLLSVLQPTIAARVIGSQSSRLKSGHRARSQRRGVTHRREADLAFEEADSQAAQADRQEVCLTRAAIQLNPRRRFQAPVCRSSLDRPLRMLQ